MRAYLSAEDLVLSDRDSIYKGEAQYRENDHRNRSHGQICRSMISVAGFLAQHECGVAQSHPPPALMSQTDRPTNHGIFYRGS